MTKQTPLINSRQKELLRMLLLSEKPVSYDELAESFKLSKRTIQREVADLKSFLSYYQLKIGKKMGSGILLKGSIDGIQQLKEELGQAQTLSVFSSEERQQGMAYSLLLSKEPIKQFVFSQKYGVSEATISNDLDKVSIWLKAGNLKLTRTPGVGIYIEGTEKERRTTLSRLLHKDVTFEEWIELFHISSNESDVKNNQIQLDIRHRLFRFVDTSNLFIVEQTVRRILKHHSTIELTDRNYVNLIVHIMLAVERIKHGENVDDQNVIHDTSVEFEIISIAKEIIRELEEVLLIKIPEMEVQYITLHLKGAHICNSGKTISNSEEFEWIELVQRYIRAVAFHLEESLEGDEILVEGLVSHFIPAFNRIKLQLQIHNPMLEKIKSRYPAVFQACRKASTLLSERIGFPIPDDEVGYIAMHIGASLIRKKDILKQHFKTIIVCASGLGTSTYLASRLQNEISNLKIEAIISLNELEQWLVDYGPIDLVISTVSLSFKEIEHYVTVSPFLTKEDAKAIQIELLKVRTKHPPQSGDVKGKSTSSIFGLAKYGEAMMQISRNLQLFENVCKETPTIRNLLKLIGSKPIISNVEQLITDLEKREKQGGFVLEELAMLHARTEGVNELLVVIFRLENAVLWNRDDNQSVEVRTFLLLAAPVTASKEHIEMISEISAALIEEHMIETIASAPFNQLQQTIEHLLAKKYETKAQSTLKG